MKSRFSSDVDSSLLKKLYGADAVFLPVPEIRTDADIYGRHFYI
jgi:hypothetical protein